MPVELIEPTPQPPAAEAEIPSGNTGRDDWIRENVDPGYRPPPPEPPPMIRRPEPAPEPGGEGGVSRGFSSEDVNRIIQTTARAMRDQAPAPAAGAPAGEPAPERKPSFELPEGLREKFDPSFHEPLAELVRAGMEANASYYGPGIEEAIRTEVQKATSTVRAESEMKAHFQARAPGIQESPVFERAVREIAAHPDAARATPTQLAEAIVLHTAELEKQAVAVLQKRTGGSLHGDGYDPGFVRPSQPQMSGQQAMIARVMRRAQGERRIHPDGSG